MKSYLPCIGAILLIVSALPAAAQQSASTGTTSGTGGSPATTTVASPSPFSAGLGLALGAETIDNVNWQLLALQPSFRIGKIGIGLNLALHFRFTGNDNSIQIRQQDWEPSSFSDFFSLYLPKIRYVSYGSPGDPLFANLGAIDNATLGNGFIVGGYTNTLLAPTVQQFGLQFGLDGSLFKFPYIGMQTFAANLAKFDVLGGELYVRPLAGTGLPILKNLKLSGIVAADRNPYLYYSGTASPPANPSVVVFGSALLVPILTDPIVSLNGMGSLAFEPHGAGQMVGVGGQFFRFLNYQAEIRFLGADFLPDYFGPTYDLYRVQNYEIATGQTPTVGGVSWYALTGVSFLANKLVFNVSLEGPFSAPPAGSTNYLDYPHLQAQLNLAPGVLPGFFFSASYDKKMISSFSELVSGNNAVVGAALNYQAGPAVITLSYALQYDPDTSTWDTTSSLSTSISLF